MWVVISTLPLLFVFALFSWDNKAQLSGGYRERERERERALCVVNWRSALPLSETLSVCSPCSTTPSLFLISRESIAHLSSYKVEPLWHAIPTPHVTALYELQGHTKFKSIYLIYLFALPHAIRNC